MKRLLLIFALLGFVCSCAKQEQQKTAETQDPTDQTDPSTQPSKRVLPSSIRFKKMDLTNAVALAVMSSSSTPSSVKTKAGGNNYRLYIVDLDGNTKLASIDIEVVGDQNDTLWKEIYKTLALVPSDIVQYSKQFLMLKDVRPVCDYDWETELAKLSAAAVSDSTADLLGRQIRSLFEQVSGNYLLRPSDGALFNCPVVVDGSTSFLYDTVNSTADGKNLVFIPFQGKTGVWAIDAGGSPMVLSDNGSSLELRSPSQQLFETGNEDYAGFFISPDNRIVPLVSGNGTWVFSMELTPLFVDYSENLKPLMATLNGASHHNYACQIGENAYLLYWKSEKVQLHKVFIRGDVIDSERIGDSSVRFPKYIDSNVLIRRSETGIVVFYEGGISTINVLTGEMSANVIPSGFPQNPLEYNENGFAYTCDGTNVQKFNINTKVKTTIPIKWSTTEFGGFVSISGIEYMDGVFIITGLSRTAQTVTVVVDAETGDVTVTGTNEYGGSVISTYYRLN